MATFSDTQKVTHGFLNPVNAEEKPKTGDPERITGYPNYHKEDEPGKP
jgi:hypothetical protein